MTVTITWQETAADKVSRINASIPPEWRIKTPTPPTELSVMDFPRKSGILSNDELAITESSAVDLVAKMANAELTAVAVTTAFCKRAAMAHQLLNCALEFFPERAISRAKELDEYFERTGKTVGPLHGLPISLKDQFKVKGLETSMGYVAWLGKYAENDSVLVTLLYRAGAVFYIKTSVPQSLMCGETFNNIIGRTVNPRNKNLTCGGSSGGEGANVAFRGAVIGVGTDIGGSIRIPSAFNFLYGLRPSHGRMPYANMVNSMMGQETVHSVCGPLTHSVADMRLFMKSVLAEEPWKYDAKVIPMPWRQEEEDAIKAKASSGGLTIGFCESDGIVRPHPPIIRGVKTVVDILKQNGHEVFEWTPYKNHYALKLGADIFRSDAGIDIKTVLKASGEPGIPNLPEFITQSALPQLSINELWDLQTKKWEYQNEYLEQLRVTEEKLGREIDALVIPCAPSAAARHDRNNYHGYTMTMNLLDLSVVVVPVGWADRVVDGDGKVEGYEGLNGMDKSVFDEYDPDVYHGAPVAVQVVGRRLTEERIMAVAEEIGRLLGNEIAS